MLLSILNYVTDVLVAIALSNENDTDWWFTLTLIFVLVPLAIVNMFSIFWFHQDHKKFRKYKKRKNKANDEMRNENITAIDIANDDATEHPVGSVYKPLSHSFSDKERKIIILSHLAGIGPILRYVNITLLHITPKS